MSSRHVYECHVRFSDVDIYRHVNNVKYFEYYQEARLAFLTELTGSASGPGAGSPLGLVVARIQVDYKRPLLFRPEPYSIESWVTRVGTSSFGLRAEIKDGDRPLSRAEAAMVAFDLSTQRARPLDSSERAHLEALLEP